MNDMEKLRLLLPHWMEHNTGHEEECGKWAETARNQGQERVAELIEEAVARMKEVNSLLAEALETAGGAAQGHHHHHHHHHHDE